MRLTESFLKNKKTSPRTFLLSSLFRPQETGDEIECKPFVTPLGVSQLNTDFTLRRICLNLSTFVNLSTFPNPGHPGARFLKGQVTFGPEGKI